MTDTMPYRSWLEQEDRRKCRRKRTFTSEPRAHHNAERAADLYGEPRSAWAAYSCDVARRRHWHIGHREAGGHRG